MRPEALLARLRADLGAAHVLHDAAAMARYAIDERTLYHGRPLAVVRPGSTADVVAVVQACRAAGHAVVPQGGNTGYCGGATPDRSGTQVVVSLERLDRVLDVDVVGASLTLEAGVTLAAAQDAAAAAGLLLPLSMGSQASCQIGGNLATNAGGLAVLRYGTTRQLVLGLEAVLPDGRVYAGLRTLRKDNTGYDLKHWFIGAEGTLGIITRAALALFPRPTRVSTLFAAVADVASACRLLGRLRAAVGDNVTSFEYLSQASCALVAAAFPDTRLPLSGAHAHYVLAECAHYGPQDTATDRDVAALAAALEDAVDDVVLAHGDTQRRALWQLRERIPAAEKVAGGSIKHDVAVPLGAVPALIEQATATLRAGWPAARLSLYGHLGDGNLHYNVLAPAGGDAVAFRATQEAAISAVVHDAAHACGGSFSAEHGVGQLKRALVERYRGAVDVALMRALKRTLDPDDLMNPGKLVP